MASLTAWRQPQPLHLFTASYGGRMISVLTTNWREHTRAFAARIRALARAPAGALPGGVTYSVDKRTAARACGRRCDVRTSLTTSLCLWMNNSLFK